MEFLNSSRKWALTYRAILIYSYGKEKKQNKKQQQQKTIYEENTLKKDFFVKVFVNQLDFAPENELPQYSANWRPSKV